MTMCTLTRHVCLYVYDKLNSFHALELSLFKIYLNTIILSTPNCSKQYNCASCSHKVPVHTSLLSRKRYTLHPFPSN